MKLKFRDHPGSIATLATILLLTCNASNSQERNDIKWIRSSVEYAASCIQIYRNALEAVREAAKSERVKWVVVLDVDETVLDNSQYQAERAAVDSAYTTQSWAKWVLRKEAKLVPGAKMFIDRVRTLGPNAHIAYVTNRNFEQEAETIENLEQFDLFKRGDIILTRKDREDTKVERRRCLEKGTDRCAAAGPLKILALLGDNIRDFMSMRGLDKANNYRTQDLPSDPNWGRRYFMLPNPSYGAWERDYR